MNETANRCGRSNTCDHESERRKLKSIANVAAAGLVMSCAASPAAVAEPATNGVVVFRPEEHAHPLTNPGMGWLLEEHLLFPDDMLDRSGRDRYPEVTAIEILYPWRAIETNDNVFAWNRLDASIAYWTKLRKKIVFRIAVESEGGYDPKNTEGMPDWLRLKLPAVQVRRENYGAIFEFPDYNNETYRFHVNRFLQALAGRYRDNPDVILVALVGYGCWGEWHSGHDFDTIETRIATLRRIIDDWIKAWGDKPLLLSASYEWRDEMKPAAVVYRNDRDLSYENYKSYSAFDYALARPTVGFCRLGFGGAIRAYDSRFLREEAFKANKNIPIMAEFFSLYGHAKLGKGGGARCGCFF